MIWANTRMYDDDDGEEEVAAMEHFMCMTYYGHIALALTTHKLEEKYGVGTEHKIEGRERKKCQKWRKCESRGSDEKFFDTCQFCLKNIWRARAHAHSICNARSETKKSKRKDSSNTLCISHVALLLASSLARPPQTRELAVYNCKIEYNFKLISFEKKFSLSSSSSSSSNKYRTHTNTERRKKSTFPRLCIGHKSNLCHSVRRKEMEAK